MYNVVLDILANHVFFYYNQLSPVRLGWQTSFKRLLSISMLSVMSSSHLKLPLLCTITKKAISMHEACCVVLDHQTDRGEIELECSQS